VLFLPHRDGCVLLDFGRSAYCRVFIAADAASLPGGWQRNGTSHWGKALSAAWPLRGVAPRIRLTGYRSAGAVVFTAKAITHKKAGSPRGFLR
jgi:hypothetical protein